MTGNPVVDVVIPVYNRTDIFLEALNSVINQDYQNLNIFIVEDGSNLLNKYFENFQKFKNIKYFNLKNNCGPSFSRNFGAAQGSGNYVTFLDSDDLWVSSKIRLQVEFMENHPDYLWVHANETWLKNGEIITQKKEHRKQGGFIFERLMKRCLISPSSVLFDRNFFLKNGGFAEHFRIAEDYELWLRLNLFNKIGFIEEPLTIKRSGNWEQLSSTPEIDRYRILALHRIYRLFHNTPEFNEHFEAWKKNVIKKTQILIKGAEKYNKPVSLQKYQNWLKLFSTF